MFPALPKYSTLMWWGGLCALMATGNYSSWDLGSGGYNHAILG